MGGYGGSSYPMIQKNPFGGPDNLQQTMMGLVQSFLVGQEKQKQDQEEALLAKVLGEGAAQDDPQAMVDQLLSSPMSVRNKALGMGMMKARREALEPYSTAATKRIELKFYDEAGKFRTLMVPEAAYNQVSQMVVDKGGKLLDPNEKEPRSAEQLLVDEYRSGKITRDELDQKVNALRRSGAARTDLAVNVGPKAMIKLGETMSEGLVKEHKDVQGAAAGLENLYEARKLLDAGMITGTGAEWMTNFGNFLNSRLGVEFDTDAVANTQAYSAMMGRQVGEVIKQFGSGTGLSDADRDYAEKIAGGKIGLNEKAIRKILDINERAYKNVITRFNEKAGQAMKQEGADKLPFDLRVAIPAAKKAPAVKQIKRTGMLNGRKVVEYTDGSIENAD